jgi:hypothetical protein
MITEEAIRIARLWKAGKMIGHPEDEVAVPLLEEVDRLRGAIKALLDQIYSADGTAQLDTSACEQLLTDT